MASYLVHELRIDWRWGAEYFESALIDSDVHSNWGNWNAMAGLCGGRINRFNIAKQSQQYDPAGQYVVHWLGATATASVHKPPIEPAAQSSTDAQNGEHYGKARAEGYGKGRGRAEGGGYGKGKGRVKGGGTRPYRKSDFELYG